MSRLCSYAHIFSTDADMFRASKDTRTALQVSVAGICSRQYGRE